MASETRTSEYRCPICQGAGALVKWHTEGRIADGYSLVPCSCRSGQLAADQLLNQAKHLAGLDQALYGYTFESFKQDRQPTGYKAALAFARRPRGILYLAGTPGTGKTHLLAAICNALLSPGSVAGDEGDAATGNGLAPSYVVAPRLVEWANRAAFERDADQRRSDQARWAGWLDIPVLLLDDLGAEREGTIADSKLFELIDYRIANRRPIAIASNLRPDEFPMRLKSRLQDRGLVRGARMDGDDYRASQERKADRDAWD